MTDLEVSCGSGRLCQQEFSHNIDLISTPKPGRVSDPGKLNNAGLGAARCHLLGSRRQQEVGLASTQHERWASHRIPHWPQIDPGEKVAPELDPGCRSGTKIAHDPRIVGEDVAAIFLAKSAVFRDVSPLVVGKRTERGARNPQVLFDFIEIRKSFAVARVDPLEVCQSRPGYHRANVVQYQAANR